MVHSKENEIHILEDIMQQRLQSAQQRVKNTEDAEMKRYYKGQVDALQVVLRDIDSFKFELGMELAPEKTSAIEAQVAEKPAKPQEAREVKVAGARKGSRRKKAASTPVPAEAPVVSQYEGLAQDALKQGVITQRACWFYHDQLPGGRIKGFEQLYKALEENVAFRQSVQEAFAPKEPTVPDTQSESNL
jgi:hypothetical protein